MANCRDSSAVKVNIIVNDIYLEFYDYWWKETRNY
jgi:hypothetical protein